MHGRGICGGGVCGGGVHGRGACMVGGCMAGGACQGVGMVGGGHGRRDSHCSGRYASYWNAFLFKGHLHW